MLAAAAPTPAAAAPAQWSTVRIRFWRIGGYARGKLSSCARSIDNRSHGSRHRGGRAHRLTSCPETARPLAPCSPLPRVDPATTLEVGAKATSLNQEQAVRSRDGEKAGWSQLRCGGRPGGSAFRCHRRREYRLTRPVVPRAELAFPVPLRRKRRALSTMRCPSQTGSRTSERRSNVRLAGYSTTSISRTG